MRGCENGRLQGPTLRVGLSKLRGTIGGGAPIRLLRKVWEDEEGEETEEEERVGLGRMTLWGTAVS